MITCCFCNKTMEPTDKCRRLFDMDICPECSDKLARVAEKVLIENEYDTGIEKETIKKDE